MTLTHSSRCWFCNNNLFDLDPQFEVLAVDSGRPARTTTADVTVLVTRDEFAPEFISTPYTATITENAAINSTVLTVRATDRDLEVRD